jgi:hypothetical protein
MKWMRECLNKRESVLARNRSKYRSEMSATYSSRNLYALHTKTQKHKNKLYCSLVKWVYSIKWMEIIKLLSRMNSGLPTKCPKRYAMAGFFRVVTLNMVKKQDTLEETKKLRPDILCVQEVTNVIRYQDMITRHQNLIETGSN